MDFKLDTREFQKALNEYYKQTEKDLSYVINRSALNVALKAAAATTPAERSSITGLVNQAWWPRYVAKRLAKKNKGKFTKAQARTESRKIIQARIRTTGWLKAGWIPAIRVLSALKLRASGIGSAMRGAGKIKSPRGEVRPARDGFNPTAVIANASATNQKALGRVTAALQSAFNLAAADMMKYLKERGQQTANKFSKKR